MQIVVMICHLGNEIAKSLFMYYHKAPLCFYLPLVGSVDTETRDSGDKLSVKLVFPHHSCYQASAKRGVPHPNPLPPHCLNTYIQNTYNPSCPFRLLNQESQFILLEIPCETEAVLSVTVPTTCFISCSLLPQPE